jgi:hypothetical protein
LKSPYTLPPQAPRRKGHGLEAGPSGTFRERAHVPRRFMRRRDDAETGDGNRNRNGNGNGISRGERGGRGDRRREGPFSAIPAFPA